MPSKRSADASQSDKAQSPARSKKSRQKAGKRKEKPDPANHFALKERAKAREIFLLELPAKFGKAKSFYQFLDCATGSVLIAWYPDTKKWTRWSPDPSQVMHGVARDLFAALDVAWQLKKLGTLHSSEKKGLSPDDLRFTREDMERVEALK